MTKVNSPNAFASGVYQIRCVSNGKIYIGSTNRMAHRWGQHKRKLRNGNHHNIYLQNAWNKYGEDSFEFSVLEYAEASNLLEIEQRWIDQTGCIDKNIGFNIYDQAGSPGDSQVQVWEGFIDPEGNEVTIVNLFDFCRQNALDFPSMHRLAMGKSKLKSYKGWTHKNSPRKRDFIKTHTGFINPDGVPVAPITNLAAFCRENGLDDTHMIAVAKGRILSHRGWTHVNGRESLNQPKTYTGFIAPNFQRVTITNLSAFCRENGLDVVHMREVKAGRRKSHKGWTWSCKDE
ncbi:MAG TPA: GIY-YIG nuclease family protein [Anaerolineales bacterium]|nr:GIY-YIG nuclease family protein [Anaerolineales bacterium]